MTHVRAHPEHLDDEVLRVMVAKLGARNEWGRELARRTLPLLYATPAYEEGIRAAPRLQAAFLHGIRLRGLAL